MTTPFSIRTELRPGDLGTIAALHGTFYAREFGFDATFEAYVAGPLAEFVKKQSLRERLWIAEQGERIVGCIAIVGASDEIAQLRWYLVDPAARGQGLGKRLLGEAIAFAKAAGYTSIFLWTVSALTTAARLYSDAGFVKVAEMPTRQWGVSVVEERYELQLKSEAQAI